MSDPTEQIPDYVAPTENTKVEIEAANKDNYVGTISFTHMNLKKEVMQAITDCGFEHPSEVQSQVIPKALLRQDILCQAKSGMGKTAVFVITILNSDYVLEENNLTSLVICHTREMALQIQKEFERMKKRLEETIGREIKVAAFVGGIDEREDIRILKNDKPNIVIGTPGRLCALARKNFLDLSHLKTFVIDECDKIIEQNSFLDVGTLFTRSPKDKQVMMFSATISEENKTKCRAFLREAMEVFIDDGEKLFLHGLHLYYKTLTDTEKMQCLMNIIEAIDYNQCIIFTDTVRRCEVVYRKLEQLGNPVSKITGRMRQQDREREYNEFKENKTRILVSTDLCGRGIDISKVNCVVNFDMPNESDQFLHRVGRAGRFGTKGIAISFVDTESDIKIFAEVKQRFSVEMDELPENLKDIPVSYYK